MLWEEAVCQKAGKVSRGGMSCTGICGAWVPQPKGHISRLSPSLVFPSHWFFALSFKGAMLLVMSFGGLCAVRRLCSLAEASVLFWGDRTTTAYVRGAGCSAPAVLWPQRDLPVPLSPRSPFPSAVTAKLTQAARV